MTGSDILIVDANRTVRGIVERTLRAEGYRVRAVGGGAEALQSAAAARPTLVLLDASDASAEKRSALEGHGLRRAFAQSDVLRNVPFVAMVVRPSDEPAPDVGARALLDTLTKPFSPEALVAALTAALARSATPAAAIPSDAAPPVTGERSALGEVIFAAEDALAGRVEHVSLADVLQMLAAQQQTGTLEVRSEDLVVAIGLSRGRVDLALGEGRACAGTRLGRILVEEGAVSRAQIDEALAAQRSLIADRRDRDDPALRLGTLLVEGGAVTKDELTRALGRQTTELVAVALRAARGTFRFVRSLARREAAEARLGMPLSPLLLEGIRRLDEWRVLTARVESVDVVLAAHDVGVSSLGEGVLVDDERELLARLDGRTSLRDLAGTELARVATRLLALGVARVATDD